MNRRLRHLWHFPVGSSIDIIVFKTLPVSWGVPFKVSHSYSSSSNLVSSGSDSDDSQDKRRRHRKKRKIKYKKLTPTTPDKYGGESDPLEFYRYVTPMRETLSWSWNS